MISSLPSNSPFSNPAGRSFRQVNTWRESQPVCTQRRRKQNSPASMIHWDPSPLPPPPNIFPLKTVMTEQNPWSWSLDMSSPSPKIGSFSDSSTFPLYQHCLSQPNLLLLLLLLLSHFSRVRLCATPIDGSPPGSPVPGILQARTLEWVTISFSNAWKCKVKVKSLSRVRLFAIPWTAAYQAPPPMGFSRQEHWSGLPLPSPNQTCVR